MSGRFDYIKYDEQAASEQAILKGAFADLEKLVTNIVPAGRAQSLVMTKLEEAYMWVGKGLRDKQIAKSGSAEPQEGRSDS